jgi:hypothetical protein
MPIITPSKQRERTPIPVGDHLLTLTAVRLVEQPNRFAEKDERGNYKATGTTEPPIRPQLVWQFDSDQHDEEGEAYEYAVWTGLSYGHPKANLTAFLDQILPESDEQMKGSLDTETLLGRRFRSRIQMVKDANGNPRPRAMYFEPIAGFDPDLPV